MSNRHFFALILVAFHALLVVLNYFGFLQPMMDGLVGHRFGLQLETVWAWLHIPAAIVAGLLHEGMTVLIGRPISMEAVGLISLAALAAQDLFVGYLLGGIFDLPWEKFFGKKVVEKTADEKIHKDLLIAEKVAARMELDEKNKLADKVARLKKEKAEKAAQAAG